MLMELVARLKCKLTKISLSSCSKKNISDIRNNPCSLEDGGSALSISFFFKFCKEEQLLLFFEPESAHPGISEI